MTSLMDIGLRPATRDRKRKFFCFRLFVMLGVAYFGLGTCSDVWQFNEV